MIINNSNELNFLDVYRTVNYTGSLESLHEPFRGSFTLRATQCSLYFDKNQKNEIHSLERRLLHSGLLQCMKVGSYQIIRQ